MEKRIIAEICAIVLLAVLIGGFIFTVATTLINSSNYYDITATNPTPTPTPNPTLTVSGNTATCTVGEQVTLTAQFDRAVANKPITFYFNGSIINPEPILTDATGKATLIVTISTEGTHRLTATCDY